MEQQSTYFYIPELEEWEKLSLYPYLAHPSCNGVDPHPLTVLYDINNTMDKLYLAMLIYAFTQDIAMYTNIQLHFIKPLALSLC